MTVLTAMAAASPYYIIIALGCFAGAALMLTRLRREVTVSVPTGILLILAGIYLLCGQFIKGFSGHTAASWGARGVLVVFLIYILLSYNNTRAEQNAAFEEPEDDTDTGKKE